MELFFNILTAQLINQDPLEPMDNMDFTNNMTSISSLQQMQTLTDAFQNFASQQKAFDAHSLLGMQVTTTILNSDGTPVSGKVSSVGYDADNTALIFLEGSSDYITQDQILKVELPSSST